MKKTILAVTCLCVLFAVMTMPALALKDPETVEQTIKYLGIMNGDLSGNMNLAKPVTRAEFSKMMISASNYKDTVEKYSGYSPFKDVKSAHWASGYIKAAVDAKWVTGYTDGTFRPDATITFEEAASAMLKMLGYDASDLIGSFPGAQISKFRALKLDDGVFPAQGKALTRNECMYFFYNLMGASTKSGAVYGTTLGHPMNEDGEVDYEAIIKDEIKGPFVINASPLSDIVPFSLNSAVVYRNNSLSVPGAVGLYDVVYYNANLNTIWAYSNRVAGIMTAVSPNAVSPASVTVGGNSYALETAQAADKVSVTGMYAIGDTVVLLLGMDGTVADIIHASQMDMSYCGMVQSIEQASAPADITKDITGYILTIVCTDGNLRQFAVSGKDYTIGDIVIAGYSGGEVKVRGTGGSSLSGKVSTDGKQIGGIALADNVEILEVTKSGSWMRIYPSRLSGATLPLGSVHYHVQNENGEISRLILADVTGDLHTYGILTSVKETKVPSDSGGITSLSGNYKYISDGKETVYNSTDVLFNVKTGPAIINYSGTKITGIENLSSVQISEVSQISVTGGYRRYTLSDNLQVYLKSGSDYILTYLSSVNTTEYKLTGYFENIYPAGGRIRIIIAEKKI